MEKPKNIKHAKEKYKQHESNLMKFLYEFKFKVDDSFVCCLPQIFVGPVKGGTGFQMNQNRTACTAIRIAFVQNMVMRYEVIDGLNISGKFKGVWANDNFLKGKDYEK